MRFFVCSLMVLFMVFGNKGWAQEEAPVPDDTPPEKVEKKAEKPEKKPNKKDDKKAEEKKDESPLSKSLSKLKIGKKPLELPKTLVPALIALGNTTKYTPNQFGVWSYAVPSSEFGIETHCGTSTGFLGAQDGWALFASTQSGSGLSLAIPAPVVFIPIAAKDRAEGDIYGVPRVIAPNKGNGFSTYLGTGPGLYLVQIPVPVATVVPE